MKKTLLLLFFNFLLLTCFAQTWQEADSLRSVYINKQIFDTALIYAEKAADLVKTEFGENDSLYADMISGIGYVYGFSGNYKKAITYFQKELEIRKNTQGKTHQDYSKCLSNIGALYTKLGQYEKTLPLFQEALENTEKSLGKEHAFYGAYLNNLAFLYMRMGEYEKTLPLHIEALENTKKTRGTNHPRYGITLNNLAELYRIMGQYEKALHLYLEALENAEKTLGKEHSNYGNYLNNLALLYQDIGEYEKALPLYLEALENTKKSLGKGHSNYGRCLYNLALLYQDMGQYEKALPMYVGAIYNNFHNLNNAFTFLSENEKQNYVNTILRNFSICQSFLMDYASEEPEVGSYAFNLELTTKGMILNSGIQMRQSILNSGNIEALDKYDEWIIVRTNLANQYSMPINKRSSDINLLEQKAEKIEGELARISNTFKQSTNLGSIKWQDIQKKLNPNEYAVEFASFHYRSSKTWTDSIMYIALVMGHKDDHPKLIKLCEQRQLDNLLNKGDLDDFSYVNNLYKGIGSSLHLKEGEIEYGDRLYKLIWEPLTSYIEEGSKVYFAPSGSLHQIAFAAVPYIDNKRLSDVYNLQQLSTTAMLLEKEEEALFNSIALFGGISYDVNEPELLAVAQNIDTDMDFVSRSLPESIDRGDINWPYLPGTLNEVKSISYLAEKNDYSTIIFTGNNALEENFKILSGINSPDIVHIATHGFYFPAPEKGKDEENQYQDKSAFQISENPLNRTGLLFAGANHTWRGEFFSGGIEDGILTAYEASNVSLLNTKLIVLSACETGLGDIQGSEGVFGLQRAFKAAGAKYLLMSLWKVPDNETAMFMEYFYKQIFTGKNVSDSFKETQEYMKNKFPLEPYKWAAFVLVK